MKSSKETIVTNPIHGSEHVPFQKGTSRHALQPNPLIRERSSTGQEISAITTSKSEKENATPNLINNRLSQHRRSFSFPSFFDLPPFFTLQPVATTRRKQIQLWSELILSYCRFHRVAELSVHDEQLNLFKNDKIQRKLSAESIRCFLDELISQEFAEWLDPAQKTHALVYCRKLEDWAAILRQWAVNNGLVDSVFTLYELSKGQSAHGEQFFGLDVRILQKAIRLLEQQGKAKLFIASTGDAGVKFFA